MIWHIGLTREAEKCLRKLPANIVERAKDSIRIIAENPYVGKPLRGDLKGQFSFRIGEYRIVYTIEKGKHIIYALYIRHRKDAYK